MLARWLLEKLTTISTKQFLFEKVMKIFVGADHNGFQLKGSLVSHLVKLGYEVDDEGDTKLDPNDDFPIFAARVVNKMLSDSDESRGILICGSGQGMAMAANRHKGIRAAVIWDKAEARDARNDDDSNVLALPARLLSDDPKRAYDIVETWLTTPFERATRFVRRIKEMDDL